MSIFDVVTAKLVMKICLKGAIPKTKQRTYKSLYITNLNLNTNEHAVSSKMVYAIVGCFQYCIAKCSSIKRLILEREREYHFQNVLTNIGFVAIAMVKLYTVGRVHGKRGLIFTNVLHNIFGSK